MSDELKNIILGVIRDRIETHPRSQQKRIGPSEIGHPCDRWITYKLADTPVIPRTRDKWRPTVGTAVHSWLAKTFEASDRKLQAVTGKPVWLVEHRVAVGKVYTGDGYEVYGGCDLYGSPWKTVVDWKIVGKTTLTEVRRKGDPGDQYRKQVHSYGRGWVRAGYDVDTVAVFFLPASGTLDEGVWWEEPYDEKVCTDAIDRVTALQSLVDQHGSEAPAMVKPVAHYCQQRCEWFRPNSEDLTRGCPGVDIKEDPLLKLIAPEAR